MKQELAAREAKIKALEASIAQKESASGAGTAFPYSASNLPGRVLVSTLLGAADGGASMAGQTICIGGWVRTGREQGNNRFAFLEINDGSCFKNMQVIVNKEIHDLKPLIPIGTSIGVKGIVKKLDDREQAVELQVKKPSHTRHAAAHHATAAPPQTAFAAGAIRSLPCSRSVCLAHHCWAG